MNSCDSLLKQLQKKVDHTEKTQLASNTFIFCYDTGLFRSSLPNAQARGFEEDR